MNNPWDDRAKKQVGLKKVMSLDTPLKELEERSKNQIKMLIDYIGKLNVETILDYGCGIGRLTKPLSNKWDVIGVDTSKVMIELAKGEYPKLCFVFLNDKFISNFKGSFDLVLSYTVLQHLPDEEFSQATNNISELSRKYILLVESVGEVRTEHLFQRPLDKYPIKGFRVIDIRESHSHTLILQEKINR